MYSLRDLEIDYENVVFKIAKKLIPSTEAMIVKASYEYWTTLTSVREIAAIIDGRWDTQVQTEFYAQPPSGYNYAIMDLGAVKDIQALDLVAGFFRPDQYRKFDIDMDLKLQYSINGTDYFNISSEASSFGLTGGASKSFEEDELGASFRARYLKIIINNVKKLDYGNGIWIVAFSEISAYNDIILKSEATLIPTDDLESGIDPDDYESGETYTILINDTTYFEDPESGETATAYIAEDPFTYEGLTANSFTGCIGLTDQHLVTARVHQTIKSNTTLYDDDKLLNKLGDRLYKEVRVDNQILYNKDRLDTLARAYLEEYYKNHSKINVSVLYQPHLQVGQTVRVTDTYNDVDTNYFIESITENSGFLSLVLARYPG